MIASKYDLNPIGYGDLARSRKFRDQWSFIDEDEKRGRKSVRKESLLLSTEEKQ
jgi:hypothetical protein